MNCWECSEKAVETVEVGSGVLHLCPSHAAGHRRAQGWDNIISQIREAEKLGDLKLAEALDKKQMAFGFEDTDDFPEFIE